MRFAATEEIDAPIGDVFAQLSDVERFERMAVQRGAELTRTSPPEVSGLGMTWDLTFELQGHRREMALEMIRFEAPHRMEMAAQSANLACAFVVELSELSPERTRAEVTLDLEAQSLSARLFVKSLSLAKGTLTKRFASRVAETARELEERHFAAH